MKPLPTFRALLELLELVKPPPTIRALLELVKPLPTIRALLELLEPLPPLLPVRGAP